MKKQIRKAALLAAAMMVSGSAFAVELLIESFENNLDPAAWAQVSPSAQTHNATNGPIPTYVSTNVTEGLLAGQFSINWNILTPTAAGSNPHVSGGPFTFWSMRNNIGTPANFPNSLIPNTGGSIIKADIFNPSTTDTYKVAFIVQDNGGTGALERGPFVDLPPNTSTAYAWAMGVDTTTGWVTGNGTLDGGSSRIKSLLVYTETQPTASPLLLGIDNIRVDTPQADLTPPATPNIVSVKQGTNPGELIVKWETVADVDTAGYRVYVAADSNFTAPIQNRLSFPGTPTATVNSPSATETTLTGLTPDTNVYVRVTAFDTATPVQNESASDIALGANLATDGAVPTNLVVLDYNRYTPTDGDFFTNGYFHGIVYWAQSLAVLPRHFTSARSSAIDSGNVTLNPAGVVFWSTGRDGELVADQTITAASQTAISALLGGGGSILVTGSAIGEDLTTNGDVADQAFYANVLKAGVLGSDNAAVSTIDADLSSFPTVGAFATGTDVFNVAAGSIADSEVLTASGSTAALTYTSVTTGSAALLSGNNVVYLGFPFETVRDAATQTGGAGLIAARAKRTGLLTDALNYLDAAPQLDATNWSLYE